MADATTAPDVASFGVSFPPQSGLSSFGDSSLDDLSSDKTKDLEGKLTKLQEAKVGAEAGLESEERRRDQQYRSRMNQMISEEGATIQNLHPWNAEQQLEARKTSLWDQFGSPGFVIGMIGSLFTAQPMNSALNAGAAAMNSINQGDMKNYEKAFDAWKENTDLVIKRLNMMHTEFADIDKLRQTDISEWRERMTAAAARFNDKATMAYMEAGMFPEMYQRMAALQTAKEQISTAKAAIEENDLRRRLTMAALKPGDASDPTKLVAAAQRAETLIAATKTPGTPEQQLWNNFIIKNPDATDEEKLKKYQEIESAKHPTMSVANVALQRFLQEHPEATPEQIQAFVQSGRAGRSALSMYMTRYLQEHPEASADEVKRAAQLYTTQTTAQNRFLSGPQGNTIRSLNVVVSHLQTMQDLGNALNNGNITAFNRIAQRYAEETGSPAPTNFDTAKQIVGAEVIKALGVAGAGSQAERQEAADAFNRARSPAQLAGAIEAARKLLVGQLEGLRRQYVASTGLEGSTFDEMLEPETRSFFGEAEKSETDKDGWTTMPNGIKIREIR